MKNIKLRTIHWFIFCLIFVCCLSTPLTAGAQRFQIEIYGGFSYLDPKDVNLFSTAEEKYNDFYFIQPQLYKQGYFINDFPEITSALPAGLCLKYWISSALSFSISAEAFSRHRDRSIEGTMAYIQPTWSETQTKTYDPFSLSVSGFNVLGGLSYRFQVGKRTDLEVGIGAGWGKAHFEFSSTWSHSVHFLEVGYWEFLSVDGGTVEGDGSGHGFTGRVNLRLCQQLGQNFGFFVETSGTYCRMKSISGAGRETRLGIPGESIWEGEWGIKKEEIQLASNTEVVYVPTNFWEGWTETQWDRDFVLDLSRVQLVAGIYLKF